MCKTCKEEATEEIVKYLISKNPTEYIYQLIENQNMIIEKINRGKK